MTKLIHIASINKGGQHYLFLKEITPHHYVWFEGKDESVSAPTIPAAITAARNHWRANSFRLVNCGFRYTLPERDEHGMNALYHQMAASYATQNGVYFDEELGHNCLVQNASQEALNLWKELK